MVEKNVKVVIGANFGDEGKGLMTDYFCHQSALRGENCIVVCHNGGAQRGHTADTPEGLHHVFHHFGSGTFVGADTYLSEEFILNPMVFRKEWEELKKLGFEPNVYVHPMCRITTPFDMILNQLIEEKRSENRHGSCGIGIYETIERNRSGNVSFAYLFLNDFCGLDQVGLELMRDKYFTKRLSDLNVPLDKEWREIFYNKGLIEHYLNDLIFMKKHSFIDKEYILDRYKNIVFEGGQGLLLDQNNTEYFPHLTPSNTGLKNPREMILRLFPNADVEVCYVTRPYLTRHGAGRFDNECSKEEINPNIEDSTNVPNPHQGSLRYGKMDVEELQERICKDFSMGSSAKLSLAITHVNETTQLFKPAEDMFDIIYHSHAKTRRYMHIRKQG